MNALRGFTFAEMVVIIVAIALFAVIGVWKYEELISEDKLMVQVEDGVRDAEWIFQYLYTVHRDLKSMSWVDVSCNRSVNCYTDGVLRIDLYREYFWSDVCVRNSGSDLVVSFFPDSNLLEDLEFVELFSSEMDTRGFYVVVGQNFDAEDLSMVIDVFLPVWSR